jgi:hypothetical protein
MTDWETWAVGVLEAIGAPVDATNAETLWAWSNKESGADVMRWNNPLNTTQWLRGSVDMNSVGVKKYGSVADGILATQVTLKNGYYPVILANLRGSVPRASWSNACPNLGTWGTGCNWLQATYGPVPGNLGDDMFDDTDRAYARDEAARVAALAAGDHSFTAHDGTVVPIPVSLGDILAAVKAIAAPPPAKVDLTPVLAAIADLKAHPAAVADPAVLAIVTKIENALKAA